VYTILRRPFLACLLATLFALGSAQAVVPRVSAVGAHAERAKRAYLDADYALAGEEYRQALSQASDDNFALRTILLTNMAACEREQRRYSAAEAKLLEALAVAKSHSEKVPKLAYANTLRQYAFLLRKLHKNTEAEHADSDAERLVRPWMSTLLFDEIANAELSSPAPHSFLVDTSMFKPATPTAPSAKQQTRIQPAPIGADEISSAAAIKEAWYLDRDKALKMHIQHALRFGRDVHGKQISQALRDKLTNKISVTEPRPVDNYSTHPFAFSKPSPTEISHRWQRQRMPLRVYIPQSSDDNSMAYGKSLSVVDSSYSTLLMQAFNEWSQASNGALTFNFVTREPDADIYCSWTASQKDLDGSHDTAIGVTHYESRATTRGSGLDVKLLVVDLPTGNPISKELFYQVCLHELGHAFGLEHSPYEWDIMFASTAGHPRSCLSPTDCARIVNLYRE
jgi:hypothetical protein